MKSKSVFIYMVLLLIGVVVFNGITAHGAVIYVTTTEDNVPGSLRAAITTANTNNQDNTIHLPAGTYYLSGAAGEDANAGGDLDIDTSFELNIIGAGKTKTFIDGNNNDRVFHIFYGTLMITTLTIQKGKAPDSLGLGGGRAASGGGIYNLGNLTLIRCNIKENQAGEGVECKNNIEFSDDGGHGGGIYNEGKLTLDNCLISGNKAGRGGDNNQGEYPGNGGAGGGIWSSGILSLNTCTISGNSAGNGGDGNTFRSGSGGGGGGIYNSNTLYLNDCTISHNKAGDAGICEYYHTGEGGPGGGIHTGGYANMWGCTIYANITGFDFYGTGFAGGINSNNYLTLINCTISGNQAADFFSGGGLFVRGVTRLNSVTVVDNIGGGIRNYEDLHLINSIVANNKLNWLEEGEGSDCSGTFNWVSYSLIEDTRGCTLTGFQKDNILGEDPLLGPLQYNGGLTYTHALLPDSPAIDAGNSPDVSLDQRGNTRPVDIPGVANVSDGADIGAYEFEVYYSISGGISYGGIGLPGVTLTFSNDGGTTTTDSNGNYTHNVIYNWSGIVTPVKEGYTFSPSSRNYTALIADMPNQNYTGTSLIPPQISLNRSQFYFGANTSGYRTDPQYLLISNSGGGIIKWTTATNANWLFCLPSYGTGLEVIRVSVSATGLLPGTYQGTITVADPHAANSPQTVNVTLTVYEAGSPNLPWGDFDTPLHGATVTGSIPVTGWALDDLGIESVKIYRDPAAGEGSGLIYIGTTLMVEGARPDIEAAFPGYPNNYKAGWGYMLLTYGLPNQGTGTFTLYACAEDIEGNVVTLGTKTIYGDNAHAVKPFGAIDLPVQGGTASGNNYPNYGWALTPLPNTIPINGSSITVWVDGVPLGHPVYNENRPDVADLFPGYNNSAGAGGHLQLDTTKYQNGLHTISWSVTDNAGNADGIGSRFFTIQNLAGSMQQKCLEGISPSGQIVEDRKDGRLEYWKDEKASFGQVLKTPAAIPTLTQDINSSLVNSFEPLQIKKGYNPESDPEILYPDESGSITIEIQELERIVIYLEGHDVKGNVEPGVQPIISNYHLTPNTEHLTLKNTPSHRYQGFLSNGDQLKPLPIGSTLDGERGVFYWQPGPGFLGVYEFVFITKTGSRESKRKQLTIKISPMFSRDKE